MRAGTTTHHRVASSSSGVTTSPLPTPSAVPPTSAKGTSLPSVGAEREQVVVAGLEVPQPVERHERGCGVGAAAREATRDRDGLADGEGGVATFAVVGSEQASCADDDVVLAQREGVPVDVVLADQLDAPPALRC